MANFSFSAPAGHGSRRLGRALLCTALASAALASSTAAQAGPTLETRENAAIGAQATFNNNWAQTFEAKGSMSVPGNADLLAPFQLVQPTSVVLPTSGLAELTATVTNMSVTGGNLDADASVNPAQLVGGAPNNANNVVLNASPTTGLPALQIAPGSSDSSVIGASIIGTNIGTDTLQVTGSLNTTVINTLSAF
jgi:hypothetical protein